MWTPIEEQDLVSGTLLVRFVRGQSGAAKSVHVYDLLVEEAGDGAAEECEGRGQRRIKKTEQPRSLA
jgi:hypothetical protein